MPSSRLIILSLLLSGILANSSAEDLSDIITAAHEHHKALQASIHDMYLLREATLFDDSTETKIVFKKMTQGIKSREETITLPPESGGDFSEPVAVIELFDGESEWQINAMQGKVQMGNGGRRFQSPTVEYWIDPPRDSEILGSEIINNRDCWIIASEPSPGYNYSRVWIDKNYYLMIRVESWDANHIPTVIENTRLWYVLDDFAIPSRTLIKKNWQPSMELVTKELRVNEGLPDSLFNAEQLNLPQATADFD